MRDLELAFVAAGHRPLVVVVPPPAGHEPAPDERRTVIDRHGRTLTPRHDQLAPAPKAAMGALTDPQLAAYLRACREVGADA